MQTLGKKPNLKFSLKLRCPYCGESPLLVEKSWFRFRNGCESCDYIYEREVGYYAGASQMISFPVASLFAFILAAVLMFLFPTLNLMYVVGICGIVVIVLGAVCTPMSMSLWMWFDHKFSPLTEKDRLSSKVKLKSQ